MNTTSSRVRGAVAVELVKYFRAAMPSNDHVIRKALREVLTPFGGDVESVKASVSRIISDAEVRAYQIYLEAQKPAQAKAIEAVFKSLISDQAPAHEAISFIAGNTESLDQFYLSVAQSRKSRAGKAVETFFDALFRGMRYPFERENVVNGTPDFVFPTVAHFHNLPTDCIIFTSKRTLRERWRQITTEGSRGFVLFLGTLDPKPSQNQLELMKTQKIHVVVPEHLRVAAYSRHRHAISVEQFLADHLDPAMQRWRRNGVVI